MINYQLEDISKYAAIYLKENIDKKYSWYGNQYRITV